jgi:hypothetical protein
MTAGTEPRIACRDHLSDHTMCLLPALSKNTHKDLGVLIGRILLSFG